jgi:hypothetical protein
MADIELVENETSESSTPFSSPTRVAKKAKVNKTPTHYVVNVPKYEDKFWALLVVILEE